MKRTKKNIVQKKTERKSIKAIQINSKAARQTQESNFTNNKTKST